MIRKLFPLIIFIASSTLAFSQAGHGVYQFLDLPVSSRLAAVGSTNISLRDNDINFAFCNPALLTPETHNVVSLSMANYLADIKFGSAVYGRTYNQKNYLAVGIQYVDYGTFKETTEGNEFTGQTFTAKDMALNIMYARPLTDKISVGATLKPVYSVYERYTSYGAAVDAGVSYNDQAHLFSAGLVFRNVGTQFKGYYSDETGQHFEPLPFNIQLGLSKKLEHAPLRFSLTLHNLQKWNLNYNSTNQPATSMLLSGSNTETSTKDIKFFDMLFRHTITAVEFVPTKNFYVAAAYNHRRQKELSIPGAKGMSGFSFGGGIKLHKFHVGFGTTKFLAGNSSYQFSISTALNEFRL